MGRTQRGGDTVDRFHFSQAALDLNQQLVVLPGDLFSMVASVNIPLGAGCWIGRVQETDLGFLIADFLRVSIHMRDLTRVKYSFGG